MLRSKPKLLLSAVCAVLLSTALAGCRGFFVKPTLTSIKVTPDSPSLQVGQTLQMVATGVYDDGSQKTITSNVTWTSSAPSVVSVSSTGLIKALANSTSAVTITATFGAISGSTTVTVGQSQTVTVTSVDGTSISLTTHPAATTVSFTAQQNGNDVTSSANWNSSNSNIISMSTGGVGTMGGTQGTVTITATTSTGSGTVQVTVTP